MILIKNIKIESERYAFYIFEDTNKTKRRWRIRLVSALSLSGRIVSNKFISANISKIKNLNKKSNKKLRFKYYPFCP